MMTEFTLSRRGFVKAGGALLVTVALPEVIAPNGSAAEAATVDATSLNSWLEIHADGTIVAKTGRTEMGIGMRAYYAQMIAEELNVRPDAISLVMGDTDRTPDGGWSASFIDGALNQRKVAAYTYQALLGLAATRLGVPASSLIASDGVVFANSGPGAPSVSYADLVKGQQLQLMIPINGAPAKVNDQGTGILNTAGMTVTGTPTMKSPSQYKVIGTDFPSASIEEKVTAKTQWVADLRLPGMLHARMVRPATLGSTLVSAGTLDRQKFPTAEVVTKGNLVAVVSPNEWEAVSGARAVAAATKWTDWAGLPGHTGIAPVIRGDRKPTSRADAAVAAKSDEALKGAVKTVAVTYEQPYVKHAPIGPYVAMADVKSDGTVMVYTHSAQSQGLRAHIGYMLGIAPEKVTVRWLEGAGQYGRTSMGGDGAEADAVILSQLLGKPVRVQWTLQEDLAWSSASPGWVADLRAGLDANNKLVALQSDFYSPSQGDIRMLGAALAGLPSVKPGTGVGAATFGVGAVPSPYVIPNMHHRSAGMGSMGAETGIGLRGNIMRTPYQRQHIFMLESLLNEAAVAAKMDPIEFRLAHTTDQRMIDIIRKTAEAVGWQSRPSPNPQARRTGDTPVKGRGMAAMYRFGAYWAGVAEVEVVPSTGVVKVTKFTLGVDVGKIINPRHLTLIVQGGVVMGLSEVMKEELLFDQSKVTSADWSRYKIMTMGETPEINIVTLNREDVGFGGGGEAANSLPQPAVVAAVFDATGVQPRRAPLTPEYVKGLLKA